MRTDKLFSAFIMNMTIANLSMYGNFLEIPKFYFFFKYLQIYANIVSIGESDFEGCSSLETISYSSTLNFISPKAFKDCTSLKEFKYPDTLDYVVTKCFVGCTAVKSVELPPMIKRIEEFAFYGCICLDILIVKGQL